MTATLWLIVGVAFIAAEAFGASGIGLLFAGLAALLVGILIQAGIIATESGLLHWVIFFAATALWALVLWKPLKKFHQGKTSYSNMLGDEAVVASDTLSLDEGQVQWSGTLMDARLVSGAPVVKGTKVIITEISGTTLIVTPK